MAGKVNVMGVGFDDLTMEEAVERAVALAEGEGFSYAVTPNPELVMMAQKDAEYARTLNAAALTLADGIGVVYAAKILGRPLKGRVPGCDLAGELMAKMAQKGLKLYLFGAKPGVADEAKAKLEEKYPGLQIVGTHDGYFTEDAPIVEDIKGSGAEVLFVCLGAPKQEKWMNKFGEETGVKLAIGLGGSLDVFAGKVQRAPEKWQKCGMEWLYRLLKEPSRFGRMAKLPLFLVEALGARMKGK